MFHLRNILYLLIGLFLWSCNPAESDKSCATGKTYSPQLKACVANNLLGLGLSPIAGANQIVSALESTTAVFTVNTATDPDSTNLSYLVSVQPLYGTLTNCMNMAGSTGFNDLTCSYIASGNFIGQDSFSYYVSDGVFSSQIATVQINVANVDDDAPILNSVISTTNSYEDGSSSPRLTALGISITLPGAVDPDNEAVTYFINSVSTGTMSGTCANWDTDLTCTYLPTANYNGAVLITYTATGLSGAYTTTSAVLANLTAVNDIPYNTSVSTCANTATQAQSFSCDITASVYDVETPTVLLTYTKLGSSTCSWASIGGGIISGTPTDADMATASTCLLNYYVNDGMYTSSATSVVISLLDVQPMLSFTSTTVTVNESNSATTLFLGSTISIADGLETETVGSYTVAAPSTGTSCLSYGSLSISSTGTVTYTPTVVDFASTCFFSVNFDDGNSANFSSVSSTTATAQLTITGVNDAPTISLSTYSATVNYGNSFSGITITLDEGGGIWEDNQTASITITASPAAMLPLAGITTTTSGSGTTFSATVGAITFDTSLIDASTQSINLSVIPAGGFSGTGTVTITVSDGVTTTATSLKLTINDIYAIHGGWEEIQAQGAMVDSAGDNLESGAWDAKVRLKWRQSSVYSGASPVAVPSSYKVLRYGPNTVMTNTTVIATGVSTTLREVTDTTALAGQVYWYVAQPIDSSNNVIKIVGLTEVETVTVVTPPYNMALVHPWIVNREKCLKLGFAEVDLDYINYQSCSMGFKETNMFLVDRFEAGCNFNRYPDCSEIGVNGCVSTSNPTNGAMVLSAANGFFYNRSTGTCFVTNDSGTTWNSVASAGTNTTAPFNAIRSNVAQLPPLVKLSQATAASYCLTATNTLNCGTSTCTTAIKALPARLPTRLEQVSYSAWSSGANDSSYATLETGGDLSAASLCNSNKSNGLLYFDMAIPGPSYMDGLPFTYTAANSTTHYRSVRTGSDSTRTCTTAYGVQDAIGNVREWTASNFLCTSGTCTPTAVAAVNGSSTSSIVFSASPFNFDNVSGPGSDSAFNGWDLQTEMTNTATILSTFNVSLGLPMVTTVTTGSTATISGSTVVNSFNHDAGFVYSISTNGSRALVTGGTWQDADATLGLVSTASEAGRWSADLVPDTTTSTDIGFRCLLPLNF